ncbi:PAS domain S-box protein [Pilimelia anulata]|nr:PAS domain S-box protein [Pilimelia anulata]
MPDSLVGQLLQATPDAAIAVDECGRVRVANAMAEDMFGYPEGGLVELSVEDLVPPGVRARHPRLRSAYMADPRRRPMGAGMTLRAQRRDGTEFPVEISLAPLDTGRGIWVAAAMRDVTSRHLEMEARALLASIVESAHDAIVSHTLDGTITSWNKAAENLYGFPAQAVIGKSVFLIMPEAHHRVEVELLDRVAAGEVIARSVRPRMDARGNTVTVSVSMSPVRSNDRVVGVATLSSDLSRIEQAEAKFKGLLEAAPDATIGVTSGGRIVMANAQAERLFGYARDELIDQPIEILIPPETRERHLTLKEHYFRNPQPRQMGDLRTELRAQRKDGSQFPAEIALNSFKSGDGLLVSASVRDITDRVAVATENERLRSRAERERLEAQLQQAQRLESLGQLAGGVAHDFNNLLGIIQTCCEFVREELAHPMAGGDSAARTAALREDIDRIHGAAKRGTALTRQLLTFGRRDVVRPEVLNINAVVRGLEPLLRRAVSERIDLRTDLDGDLSGVYMDPGQLEQILMNVAVNAAHAMPDGGTLRITTANITVGEEFRAQHPAAQPGDHVMVTLIDSGTGMPPEVIAHAFDPFFTTKPAGEGSGLGLATVYGIVSHYGGHLWLESEPGHGTTVAFVIPTARKGTTSTAPTPAALGQPGADTGAGETILVVEDEAALAAVLTRMLENSNYQVIPASNGTEALDIVRSAHTIDLLVTDVVMPGMQGPELATACRRIRPTMPVIYMSGYAKSLLTEQGTLPPGVQLISKPFTQPDFLNTVKAALHTHQPTDIKPGLEV